MSTALCCNSPPRQCPCLLAIAALLAGTVEAIPRSATENAYLSSSIVVAPSGDVHRQSVTKPLLSSSSHGGAQVVRRGLSIHPQLGPSDFEHNQTLLQATPQGGVKPQPALEQVGSTLSNAITHFQAVLVRMVVPQEGLVDKFWNYYSTLSVPGRVLVGIVLFSYLTVHLTALIFVLVVLLFSTHALVAMAYHLIAVLLLLPLTLLKAVGVIDAQRLAAIFVWVQGIRFDVRYGPHGEELNSPCYAADMRTTPIVASNHVGVLDGFVLFLIFRSMQIVAARRVWKSLMGVFMGEAITEDRTVFFEKSDPKARSAVRELIVERARQWKPEGKPLILFPEGNTTNGKYLLKFKAGAFNAGTPVRPVLLVPTRDVPMEGFCHITLRAAQFFVNFRSTLHVRVYDPYIPDDAERADPFVYAKNFRAFMEANLVEIRQQLGLAPAEKREY